MRPRELGIMPVLRELSGCIGGFCFVFFFKFDLTSHSFSMLFKDKY